MRYNETLLAILEEAKNNICYRQYLNDRTLKNIQECFKLMGFPNNFKLLGSKGKLHNRIGSSIVVPMVEGIAEQVKKQIFESQSTTRNTTLFDINYTNEMLAI